MTDNKCGCVRPDNCGYCRTEEEDQVYWAEKSLELEDELADEDE